VLPLPFDLLLRNAQRVNAAALVCMADDEGQILDMLARV